MNFTRTAIVAALSLTSSHALACSCAPGRLIGTLPADGDVEAPTNARVVLASHTDWMGFPMLVDAQGAAVAVTKTVTTVGDYNTTVWVPNQSLAPNSDYAIVQSHNQALFAAFRTGSGVDTEPPPAVDVDTLKGKSANRDDGACGDVRYIEHSLQTNASEPVFFELDVATQADFSDAVTHTLIHGEGMIGETSCRSSMSMALGETFFARARTVDAAGNASIYTVENGNVKIPTACHGAATPASLSGLGFALLAALLRRRRRF